MTSSSLIFRGLLAVVAIAPLPLASNRPVAWSYLALAVGGLMVAWGVLAATGRVRVAMGMDRMLWVCAPFLLALAWAVAQTATGTPAGWRHPIWAEAGMALGDAVPGAVSLDPAMTWTAIMRLLAYGGVFWLAAQLGRDRGRAREALVAVALIGMAYAVYGLAEFLSGSETILWYEKWAYRGDLTSTFVNRNAYGAYAGAGLLCCLGLFIGGLRRRQSHAGMRDRAESLMTEAAPFLACAPVLATAVLLSHSRGAFIFTGIGLAALMAALAAAKVIPARRAVWLWGCVAALVVAVTLFSGDLTFVRFSNTQFSEDGRNELYRLVAVAIGDAPWAGFGLGAFLPAFRLYRDATLPGDYVLDFAHSVHLETLMDLGAVAGAAFYLSCAVIVATCIRGLLRRRRDQLYCAVGVAVTVQLGGHGLVDFGLQMPAVAVTFALLLGVAYAQAFNTAEHRSAG